MLGVNVKLVTYQASFTDSHPAILGPHSSNLHQWRFASVCLEALIEILVHNRMLLRKLLIFRDAEQVLLTGQQIKHVHLSTTEMLSRDIESTYCRLPSQLNKSYSYPERATFCRCQHTMQVSVYFH